ncbi:putative conjugative element protein [Streptococcus pneumoniae]|nr:putative conjugative element protein [Streptococcus pneumoniae]CTK85299.1 putative conjugative element protein [Streptococcus pneumoniae]CTK87678.1 putative conjugative element protein [Streptococcus pneumoniae]CTK92174.1 putative conjugative element protein [Streptococcus pneumoniae]CTK92743.1 putative conjugative element protein [Streptococcus pneumoniae]
MRGVSMYDTELKEKNMVYNMTDTNIKIGLLDLEMSQFDIPKKVVILSVRVNNKYKEVNGENVKTDEVSKITSAVLDADKVKVLTEMGISTDDLKAINLEIIGNLDKIAKLAQNDALLNVPVELIRPKVRLAWNMARNNWSGVKIVCEDIKVLGE